MARNEKEREYNDIREYHQQLKNVKEFGVQKHHPDWILAKVGKRFYKSPKTIENIIYHRV